LLCFILDMKQHRRDEVKKTNRLKTKMRLTTEVPARNVKAAALYAEARKRIGREAVSQLGWLVKLANRTDDELRADLHGYPESTLAYEILAATADAGGGWHPAIVTARNPRELLERLVESLQALRYSMFQIADRGMTELTIPGPMTMVFSTPAEPVEPGG